LPDSLDIAKANILTSPVAGCFWRRSKESLPAMAPSPSIAAPPLPQPILTLGVTGHRGNNPAFAANAAAIAGAFDMILDQVAAAAGSAPIRMHSLLADGTDQLAATAALARGWELAAPIPFGRALNLAINCHPQNGTDARRLLAGQAPHDPGTAAQAATLAALLDRARLFELADADAGVAALFLAMMDGPGDTDAAQRYVATASRRVSLAGRVMIEQSDLLIAVWDGASRDAVGGTGHTLTSALGAGASVILIDAHRPDRWRIVHDIEALDQPGETADRESGLAAAVAAAVRPPGTATAAAHALDSGQWRAQSSPWFHAYRRVEAVFGGDRQRWRSLRITHEPPDAVANGSGAPLLATLAALPGADAAWPRAITAAVLQRFVWADGISTRFSDRYRGGMVANFILSGAAVLAGLAYLPTVGPQGKQLFALVEFLLLAAIVLSTARAQREHWHDRWFETRRAAEYLRHAPFLLALGAARPPGRWPRGQSAPWPEQHARHALREVGLPAVGIGQAWLHTVLDGLLIPHLSSQRDYHRAKAERLERVHHRLDAVSIVAFQLAVVAVALWLLLWAAGEIAIVPATLAEKSAKLFTFLGVMFPTVGGAVAGIRYFGDFDRFAAISRVSAEKLDNVLRRACLLRASPSRDYGNVADLAHAADEVVISEIESWQAVFAGKHFTVPV
jgi:hypothetical protein